MQISHGWITPAQHIKSPNYNQRPVGAEIELLVIHNISLPPKEFGGGYIEQFFSNKLDPTAHPYFAEIAELKVSSHLLIKRDGELLQFVSLLDRAWHAGESSFEGREACNDFSIGIELEGADDIAFTDAQYDKLAEVTKLIQSEFPLITADRIVGHSDIAPGRKTDPGSAFDWGLYREML